MQRHFLSCARGVIVVLLQSRYASCKDYYVPSCYLDRSTGKGARLRPYQTQVFLNAGPLRGEGKQTCV